MVSLTSDTKGLGGCCQHGKAVCKQELLLGILPAKHFNETEKLQISRGEADVFPAQVCCLPVAGHRRPLKACLCQVLALQLGLPAFASA